MKNMFSGSMSRWMLLGLTAFLAACGSTPAQNARHVVSSTAIALDVTDIASAQAYTVAAQRALLAATDMSSYRAAVAPYDALEAALRGGHSALALVDQLVTSWEQTGSMPSNWLPALACLVSAVSAIADACSAAHVPLPTEITDAIAMAHGFAPPEGCFTDALDAGAPDAGVDGGAS